LTIAGHRSVRRRRAVLGSLGHLPHKGETISADGFSLMVDAVRENRIDLVRITRREDSSEH
jgi:CBS domain containing-hemolysin-like protein